ncbi:hypothetical protein BT96DRAFT_1010953 [Gymnopus androsaceus JB14]|uniref:Ricin B lectin domain-containing protein n=1 Tax=Gymnopus androsaceus JB14 TaxID=1447944 RepID=A0A6A4G9Z1_9AGAR|nr:hypothetical protein BT96DRAFT_1010953 [Gymnopus androsaceus JB14]
MFGCLTALAARVLPPPSIWYALSCTKPTRLLMYMNVQEVVPESSWILTPTSDGGYTVRVDAQACVAAPAGIDPPLTSTPCINVAGTDADFMISCNSCTDGRATACTFIAASNQQCVKVPGDSDGDPEIVSFECTGSPEELWDISLSS